MSETNRWLMNAYLNIVLPKASGAAGISIIEHVMLQGFGPPLHVHHDEDETFYILEGRVRFRVGDATVEHEAGQSVHVPGGTIHTFRILSPLGRFLTVTNGTFEDMVIAASVPAAYPGLPQQTPFTIEDQQRLGILCNKAGIEFLGPPID